MPWLKDKNTHLNESKNEGGATGQEKSTEEKALATLQKIKDWDIGRYQEHGEFALPEGLRKEVQEFCAGLRL